jgi:hypothetical protein
MHLTRKRAELLAQIGKKLAYKANRDGVAERFPESAVQQSIDLDLTLIDAYDRLLTDLELDLVQTAVECLPKLVDF